MMMPASWQAQCRVAALPAVLQHGRQMVAGLQPDASSRPTTARSSSTMRRSSGGHRRRRSRSRPDRAPRWRAGWCRGQASGFLPEPRPLQRRRDDADVPRAAAQMAAKKLTNFAFGRMRDDRAAGHPATSGCRPCRSRIAVRDACGRLPAASIIRPGAGASASTVRIAAPSTCTASMRQDRAGTPSICTVQAPHTPCSQPTCVPVAPSTWRRKSDSSSRGSAAPLTGRPFR